MRNKRLILVAGAILVIGALLVGATALADTDAAYYWSSATTSYVAQFDNIGNGYGTRSNTNAAGVISQYGSSYGSGATGFRGYNNVDGYGVYGRAPYGTGVYGEAADGSYGGYFYGGYIGVRGLTYDLASYAAWFSNYASDGVGVRAFANGSNATAVAAYGGDYGVYGEGFWGLYGYNYYSNGDAVFATTSTSYGYGLDAETYGYAGTAVDAYAGGTSAYAGYFISSNYRGIYADATTPMGYYDIYAEDYAYLAGTVFWDGTQSIMVRNDGTVTLKPGDLVVYTGRDDAALDGKGVVTVAKAGAAQGVIAGVVQGAYEVIDLSANRPPAVEGNGLHLPAAPQGNGQLAPAAVPDGEAPAAAFQPVDEVTASIEGRPAPQVNGANAEKVTWRFVGGDAASGQYFQMAFSGFVKVKVSAARPVKAGDWIVAGLDGSVSSAPARGYSAALDKGYFVIGRAAEALSEGTGEVLVQLGLR